MIRSPLYRPVLLILRIVLCVLLAALVVLGDLTAALIVAVFLVLSFAHLLRTDRRPAVFDVLFALAALAGALGYTLDLFGEIVPYDELTHAFTTFSESLAFYFLFYGGAVPERRAVALATSVFTLGVSVGAYWEIFEWFFVGHYTMADTINDLLVDSAGALAAAPWPRRSWLWRFAGAGIVLLSLYPSQLLRTPCTRYSQNSPSTTLGQ